MPPNRLFAFVSLIIAYNIWLYDIIIAQIDPQTLTNRDIIFFILFIPCVYYNCVPLFYVQILRGIYWYTRINPHAVLSIHGVIVLNARITDACTEEFIRILHNNLNTDVFDTVSIHAVFFFMTSVIILLYYNNIIILYICVRIWYTMQFLRWLIIRTKLIRHFFIFFLFNYLNLTTLKFEYA